MLIELRRTSSCRRGHLEKNNDFKEGVKGKSSIWKAYIEGLLEESATGFQRTPDLGLSPAAF